MTFEDIWAIGRFDLRLTDDEINRLTLRQLNLLLGRLKAREDREFLRTGIVASTIANMSGKVLNDDHSLSPADFMPGCKRKPIQQTPEEQIEVLRSMHYRLTGEDITCNAPDKK